MKKIIVLLTFLLTWNVFSSKAQAVYTDYKPTYSFWMPNYLLDKIEYTQTRTIFYFRYLSTSAYNAVSFYGKPHEDHWMLENVFNHNQTFELIEIRNLRLNGQLLKWQIINDSKSEYSADDGDVFTCEVHFARLPKNVFKVHFLEGLGKKTATNHFHCLNVRVKPFDDPELGKEKDMVNRIRRFEQVNLGYTTTPLITPKKEEQKIVKNDKPYVPPKKTVPVVIKPKPKPTPVEEAQAQVE